ncbi:MAG TPA: hypothetical protein VHZ55_33175 [Bryobacteraceae bacterium]|jgi:hypothetical protein|nr:hypothetical protein [Bryobacteraceae bacterium]
MNPQTFTLHLSPEELVALFFALEGDGQGERPEHEAPLLRILTTLDGMITPDMLRLPNGDNAL